MMPITTLRDPLNRVALPALSRLQKDPIKYREYHTKLISILGFVSIPLVVFLFICSDNIIRIILGQQWLGASQLFRILAFAALIQTVQSTRGVVLLSVGQSRKYLLLGVVRAVVINLSFVLGLPWGAKGVATAYALSNYLLLYPSLHYAFANTPVHVKDFFIAIYKPLTASLGMGVICFLFHSSINNFADIIVLTSCLILSLIVYFAFIALLPDGVQNLREYYSYGQLVLSKDS
jgi:PST family polysaccharide transporter